MSKKSLSVLKQLYQAGAKTTILDKLYSTKTTIKYGQELVLGTKDYPKNKELFTISMVETKRFLILGMVGAGKSWLNRAFWNRAYMSNITPIILDFKPEYYTSQFPLQDKFKKFLYSLEVPVGIPMNIYYPYFLFKVMGLNIPNQKLFEFQVSDIQPTDLFTFVGYDEFSLTGRQELEELLSQMMKRGNKFQNIDDIIEYIDSKKNISTSVKNVLLKAFHNLKNLEVFGDKYPYPNIADDINNHRCIDINLFGWGRLEFKKYISAYLKILISDLLISKQECKINKDAHVLVIVEEAHAFIPKKPKSKAEELIKDEFISAINTGRSEKISFGFVTQSPEDIDPHILDQVDYIFIPKQFPKKKLVEIIKNYIPEYSAYSNYEACQRIGIKLARLRRFNDGAREWMCIDKVGGIKTFVPFAPLSNHREEGEVI